MLEIPDPQLLRRLTATSHAIGVEDVFRDLADDVASWDAEGLSRKDIDHRIRLWGRENGWTAEDFKADILKGNPLSDEVLELLDFDKIWRASGYEEWLIECVRSLAFTDEPIAFYPLASGFWLTIPDDEHPVLLAVITPLSDPDLGARQLKQKFAETFGKKAARKTKANEVERARMLAQYNRGMSHKEIAIQNLRDRYPDIVSRPSKYKDKIETEKSRVAKELKVSEEVWKERRCDSSTPG